MMVVAGLALATASCSDYSDYNSEPADGNMNAGNSLYENIKSNESLKNFAAIIDKAGYGNVLNASQCYTLWAPVDGTYNADAILAMDSAQIVDRFLKHHLAQFSYPVSGEVDERVITLNDKHHTFTNAFFDERGVKAVNIPSSNGLMHLIDGNSPYLMSIYESLNEHPKDNIVKFIKDYDTRYIDERNSVKGPMVNGQQTYLDTVWKTTNPVVRSILRADIEDEDSAYVMLNPTNEAWDAAYDKIKSAYSYQTGFKFMDLAGESGVAATATAAASLKAGNAASQSAVSINTELYNDSLPKYWITRNLVYSLSNKNNSPLLTNKLIHGAGDVVRDTLYSTTRSKLSNVQEILDHCGELVKMSNGYTRTLDEIVFNPIETYLPVITAKQPIRTLGLGDKKATMHTMLKTTMIENYGEEILSELPDFLKRRVMPKNSNYVTWYATDAINYSSNAVKPEMDFAIRNALSTKYRIFVVFCPISYSKTGDPEIAKKPYYARFDLACYGYDTKASKYADIFWRLNVPGATSTKDIIIPEDGKFHYVEMEYKFDVSYFGLEAFPTLLISNTKSFGTSGNREKYEQELRIQGIYFVPEDALDQFKNVEY